MDEQRMKEEEKQRQIEEEKKKVFRISKKPRPPEEITEQTDKSAKLSAQEKLERAKKLAASFGKAKTVVFSSKFDSNKSSAVSDKSSSEHKHDKPSHSEQKRKSGNDKHSNDKDVSRQTVKKPSNDKHSNDKDVPKQSDKKPSYKDNLEKMSDQEKLAIIKKISGSLGRVGDKISDTEKLDKIRKISETIGKGSSSNSDKNEKPNGYPKYSPLSSKIDRDKMTGNFESLQKIKKKFKEAEERVNGKTITMLGKTDEGIKREVIFDRTHAETMRYALQEKAAQIRAMINKPEKPKPRERKKGKNRASETEAKGKKSETSKNEDDEQRKYSDFKKSSSHSSDTKYNYKYSDDKSSDRSSREEKPVKKKKPPPPTSMNFNHNNDLLKIAEQKSQEPVKIEVIKKPKKEEERFLTKREMASQREYQEYFKNKKIRREAEIEEKQTVDVKREKQISNSLKSKSTSNLVTKSASSSQNTVRKNPYPEKLDTKSSSPVPSSSKLSSSSKLGKSMSSSSIPSKPFIKQFKLHSATNSQHNSDSNPAKKIKREHIEKERISQKGEHRKKSNGAKRSSHDDVRENVLVCGPPKNEKPVSSNPFDRIYGEIKKNQPTKPEPKPRERKKGKDRASETEAKGKKSETSKNEDDEQRKYSDFKKSSSLSSDTKYNDKYSDDKSSDRSSREEKPVKKKKPPPPTSMHFNHNNDLLKIAEQKSQEPVKIEVIKKPKKEEERLLTKREMASQSEYQEYSKNKKIRREAEIEEKQTVDVKREKQISNSLKSKSTSNLVTKSASSSQNTVRKNRYSEKLATNSSSPVPSSSKPTSSNKLNKSMSSSSIPSKPFTKQFKLHSATNSQHNSDSNPAKKIKREHTENERISQKDEHRKKSNGAKRSNYNDVRENVLVCGPPKNEKPVCSNPFDRMYGEIKKNQPTKPDSNPAKKIKREHREDERISQKDEHRKKSNGAKRSNYNDVRENVLVCGPPKNEKPVSSNPFDRMYGEIKKNQPTKPGSLDQIRQAVIVKTDNMATSNKRRATDTRGTIKGTKRSKGTNDLDQPTPPTSEIVLRIIAKTNMNNGYCYLGFDEEHERIFRPIFNTNTCCWPFEKDFCWKKSYRFLVTLNPDEDKVDFLTPYPHCNEDMVVTSIVKEEKTVPFNVQVLISVAKLDINDIYLDIKEEKYLFNNAQSPSVGILKCRSRNVSICSDDHSKDSRFKIHLPSGHYVFPMKGINIDEIPKVDREVLVVFGLGRPYTNRRSFHPARCYILVVGLFVV
ncbi:daf-12-interacting protein 1-like isoform X3 [Mytilus californianus]|uniref:daf-12-interacting protein 1-like isoform X3 n=1 Tax=Mytilus californianus TaxID=6549 RepID=UPI0022456230|nr:daf-12-interacting protein 1-like isoform X3 [Mytilus californianus]